MEGNIWQTQQNWSCFDTREKKVKAEDHKVKDDKIRNVASIIKEMKNNVDALEAGGSTCHECTSKDGFENYTEDIVVEKEELIMKKDMGN